MTTTATKAAATERGVRTFWQGLAVDVGVAIAVVVLASVDDLDLDNREAMAAIGLVLVKTIITTVASYVMRLKVAPTAERAITPPVV